MHTLSDAGPAQSHTHPPAHTLAHTQPHTIDITFDSKGDRLFGLGLINGLLKILTLGIYSFWGKTEVRRRIWSFTRLNGEPLEYTGTGKELFLGFLVVFFLYLLPGMLGSLVVYFAFPGSKYATGIYGVLSYVLFFLLVGNAMYRATRYRLTRTRWRGIRGDLTGSPARYGWTYFWTLALPGAVAIATAVLALDPKFYQIVRIFGPTGLAPAAAGSKWSIAALAFGAVVIALILPWRSNALQRKMTNNIQFGNVPLTYTGQAAPLYKRYFLAGFGGLVLVATAIAATAALTYASLPGEAGIEPDRAPRATKLAVAGIWLSLIIALAVITAWYRANQFNHFARNTHFGNATFQAEAAGPGLAWLSLSNWLLVMLATLAGAGIGIAVAYALNVIPQSGATPGVRVEPPAAFNLIIILPLVVTTTLATTFAQFRSARYFLSRLKLDGTLNLNAILQSQSTGPKRGEGLAQVFDLDAF